MDKLTYSKEIFELACAAYKPKAIVIMLSGGDDSLACYHVARELGIKFDVVVHGNTRTGIEDTTQFVTEQVAHCKDRLIIADAGDSYQQYVHRKGFFGVGIQAHSFSYHILKLNHFNRIVSQTLRKRKHDFPILFINGARRNESRNRQHTMKNPFKQDPSNKQNIWINLINEWSRHDCLDYLEGNSIRRNPVAVNLCRSGECMCGTMQTEGDYNEAKFFYPAWGKRMDELRRTVREKFGWDWGESKPCSKANPNQLDLFQPMCSECKIEYTISGEQQNTSDAI